MRNTGLCNKQVPGRHFRRRPEFNTRQLVHGDYPRSRMATAILDANKTDLNVCPLVIISMYINFRRIVPITSDYGLPTQLLNTKRPVKLAVWYLISGI